MSLSAWEQDALDSIKDRLASSDPTLVARLAIFARLASGEEMPAREEIQVGAGRVVRRAHPDASRGRRAGRRLGLPQAALLVWLVTSVALVIGHTLRRSDGDPPRNVGTSRFHSATADAGIL